MKAPLRREEQTMKNDCTSAGCLTMDRQEQAEDHNIPETDSRDLQMTIKQYEQFIELLPDAMIIVSREGKIVQLNAQLEQLFGYDRQLIEGTRDADAGAVSRSPSP
jgi:PAS domain-containing protein